MPDRLIETIEPGRATRRGHHMLAHLRTEAYPVYRRHQYPPNLSSEPPASADANFSADGAVDYDGRLLAEASPGPGERIVVAPIDISALRHERASRRGHHMLSHLRTEAYPVYRRHQYPPKNGNDSPQLSYERNNQLIDDAKRNLS